MEPPDWARNEDSWRKQCRRLVARAEALITGKIELAEAARQIDKYRIWLRAEEDPDFTVFKSLLVETSRPPTDAVEDVKLRAIEAKFRDRALEAAHNLIKTYGINDRE